MWCKNNCDDNAAKFRKKMGSFLNYIQFKYIPCDVLVKDVYPLKIVPHYTMIRALAHQVTMERTLITLITFNDFLGWSNIRRVSKSRKSRTKERLQNRKSESQYELCPLTPYFECFSFSPTPSPGNSPQLSVSSLWTWCTFLYSLYSFSCSNYK